MKTIIVIVLITYITLAIIVYLLQRKMLYFPTGSISIPGTQEITITSDEATLHGWIINGNRDKALIYYGGNAESIEFNSKFFQMNLPDHTVYLITYRGYGKSTGTPTEQNLYKDALVVYDFVSEKHSDISLMGRSLGTGIATYVGSQRAIEKLILVSPYDSIENVAKQVYWIFPVSLLLKDKYLSWHYVKSIKAPTLILIAEYDEVIPKARTENLINHFTHNNVKTVVVPGTNHNTISVSITYEQSIKQMLNQ